MFDHWSGRNSASRMRVKTWALMEPPHVFLISRAPAPYAAHRYRRPHHLEGEISLTVPNVEGPRETAASHHVSPCMRRR